MLPVRSYLIVPATTLAAVAINGHEKTVELLLSKGADINAQGGKHINALQAAIDSHHKKIAKFLIDKGAKYQF